MNYIFVDSKKDRDYIGVVEADRLVEIYVEEDRDKFSVGNIYRGRVDNVVAGIDAAFVDIGHYKNGYLHIKDALPLEHLYGNETCLIGDILKNNDDIIVQIKKEGQGDKGVKLTSHITIPGSYIVLTPFSNRINVSRKLDRDTSDRLRAFGRSIREDEVGFVIRTNAAEVGEELIEEEYRKLLDLYRKILREKHFLPCPKLIYKDMNFLYKLINSGSYRDYKILVNSKEVYSSLMELDRTVLFDLSNRLSLDEKFSLETDRKLYHDLLRGLERKLELDTGGSIVIDRTEAMTVIDVNTGSYVGGQNLSDSILDINTEAGREIARQIRLRNISGIIIVDFIDFRDKALEEEFLREFKRELARDPNRANLVGMTRLGLVELTRKKVRLSDIDYFKDK